MAGVKALITLAFTGSLGMTLVILACALPDFGNYWPLIVTLFYLLAPIPTLIAKKYQDDLGSSNTCKEVALFITAGIVISAFALPIVLARSPWVDSNVSPKESFTVIKPGACYLTVSGNIVTFFTILGFFIYFDSDDEGYNTWS